MPPAPLPKLISRLKKLATLLEKENDLTIHRQVNQFYYMQKEKELHFLLEEYEEAMLKVQRIQKLLQCTYVKTFEQWKRDIRWLNEYERERKS